MVCFGMWWRMSAVTEVETKGGGMFWLGVAAGRGSRTRAMAAGRGSRTRRGGGPALRRRSTSGRPNRGVGPSHAPTPRHTAIVLVSPNSHYAGDIARNDVFAQNQLLVHPLTWPLQLFCCGVSATHLIHHYVVPQPFYLRTLVYFGVRAGLVAQGVRVDDLGSIARGNRWAPPV